MLKIIILAIFLGVLIAVPDIYAADRNPPRPFRSGRSVVMSPNGMVATSQPLAAQIGLAVLQKGGNAMDAAIAVNAALGLVEPMSCGIGGDLYAIVWDARTKKLYGLNASGRAPAQATIEFFKGKGLEYIPDTGPLSWSVPGCVDGWDQLLKRFGSRPLGELLEPSIQYAENGFPVSEVIGRGWSGASAALRQYPDSAKTFVPNGKPVTAGQVFKNPYLARSYRILAEKGRDAFYKGELAAAMVEFSEKNGGLFSAADFASHTSTWVDPVSTSYRGYDVWQIPPPGQGISVLQMLNVLEASPLTKLGPASPEYWHLLLEAKKLAYADRARYYTDPEFSKVPTAELISKDYAAKRRALIDPMKAMGAPEPGAVALGKSDTVYLCVVDKDRNCVSLIQSNYYGFGSGMVPGDLGFPLQNRGTLFALDPRHPNRLEPGKRPFHTIIPSFVTKDGKPWLVFGVMGGDMQPQGQVQVLVNMIDFGMDVQAAGEAPRVQHSGSATPTGRPADRDGGFVAVEVGIPEAVFEELLRRGHRLDWVRNNGGGYQAIWIDPATNMLHGGSEMRKDGCAVGY